MLLAAIFILGYLAIVFEHPLGVNKAAPALVAGVLCWTAYIASGDARAVDAQLVHHLGELSQILFFLLGAMTIVELIDAHDGFEIVTSLITTRDRRRLLATIALAAFLLSAVLDNLTASIVMMSLVRKLVSEEADRRYFAGIVIVAANSGGVWSPIGDVTTTMLWIGGQISAGEIVRQLVLPALASILVPLVWIGARFRGQLAEPAAPRREAEPTGARRAQEPTAPWERRLVLGAGLGVFLFVPAFKALTHLPPMMGVLLGLGVLWALTELLHKRKNDEARGALSAAAALQRVDAQSVLFFLGILLAISALESAGLLARLAAAMDAAIGNVDVITVSIGLSSSVVDNVPLVAAAQGMYPLSAFPRDHHFWLFLAYCAGTGGSILIIGSAAGIAVMGIQRITFGWYVRHLSLPALLGYAAGALVYLALAAARA
jgi:Na+/H+ antiporter NhaD/arsenite permease-like protein